MFEENIVASQVKNKAMFSFQILFSFGTWFQKTIPFFTLTNVSCLMPTLTEHSLSNSSFKNLLPLCKRSREHFVCIYQTLQYLQNHFTNDNKLET